MEKLRILVASISDQSCDGRVLRQVRTLANRYKIVSAGTGTAPVEAMTQLQLPKQEFRKSAMQRISNLSLLAARRHEWYYWSRKWIKAVANRFENADFDVMLVSDLKLLPVSLRAARGRPVVFDAREYYPGQHDEERFFRWFTRPHLVAICKKNLPRAAAVTTVSPGLAAAYQTLAGVNSVVLRNTPYRQNHHITPSGNTIRLVYHGVAQERRSLELLIDGVRNAGGHCELHLYLQTLPSRRRELEQHACGDPRIVFHDPVPHEDVVSVVSRYDIGVIFYPPTSLNLLHCLPNKFFDYIQARLGVLIGPSPDMAEIVHRDGIGVVTRDFSKESLVEAIRSLTPEKVSQFKQASDAVADNYCWEKESQTLLDVVEGVLANQASTRSKSAAAARLDACTR